MGYVTLKLKADEAQAVEAFRKLTAAEQQATNASKKLGLESEKTSRTNKGSGDAMVSSVKSWALGLVSVTGALATVHKMLTDINATAGEAAGRISDMTLARSSLLQIAKTPEDLRRMELEVEKSRGEGLGGIMAHKLQFGLESLNIAKHRGLIAGLYPMVEDPAEIAGGVDTIMKAMGKEETGTVRQVLNKVLAASAISRATVTEFAPGVARAAGSAGLLKMSDEETMATLAEITKPAGGAGEAATQLDAVLRALLREGITGKGIVESVRFVKAKGMSPQKELKFWGRAEALAGAQNIEKMTPQIVATTADMYREGQLPEGKDYISRMQGLKKVIPANFLSDAARIAKNKAELAAEKAYGPEETLRNFVRSKVKATLAKDPGRGEWAEAMNLAAVNLAGYMRASPESMLKIGLGGELGLRKEYEELVKALQDMRRATDEQKKALEEHRRTMEEKARFSRNGGTE